MSQVWLELIVVMLGSSVIKYVFMNRLIWVVIDLVTLGICYLVLRRYPYVDMKSSMIFLSGLTVINILIDLGWISGLFGTLISLAVVMWLLWKRRGPRRPNMRYKWHK